MSRRRNRRRRRHRRSSRELCADCRRKKEAGYISDDAIARLEQLEIEINNAAIAKGKKEQAKAGTERIREGMREVSEGLDMVFDALDEADDVAADEAILQADFLAEMFEKMR